MCRRPGGAFAPPGLEHLPERGGVLDQCAFLLAAFDILETEARKIEAERRRRTDT